MLLDSCTRVELDRIKGVVACLMQMKGFDQDLQAYEQELLEE